MTVYENGVKIVARLRELGFEAYFAGGWVRDFLLKRRSYDIDIATSAPPEIVTANFRKTIPIGARFGAIIVVAGGHQYDVTSFRSDIDYLDGRHPTKIEFVSAKKDAQRRDFTINGMFFDPIKGKILDFVGGRRDIKKRVIRAIGDPFIRFREDRLRMIRAARFAAALDFKIEERTAKAIMENASQLFPAVATERIWQEFSKMLKAGCLEKGLTILKEVGLLKAIFPSLRDNVDFSCFSFFPKKTPLILFIMTLFREETLSEKRRICHLLKVSNRDLKFMEGMHRFEKLTKSKDATPAKWAEAFADPNSGLYLQIVGAKKREKARSFLRPFLRMRDKLRKHSKRISAGKPLVTAKHLMARGIRPGKKMGELIKKAADLAANYDLNSAEQILQRLFADEKDR